MTLNRIMHIYGDKPPLYSLSMCSLFLEIGWLLAKYGEMGFGNVFPRVLGLFLVVYFIDACIKSVVIVKDHFKITLTLKE